MAEDPLRYLRGVDQKQSPRDMISASRKMLHSSLVENDKQEFLQNIQTQCSARMQTLSEAKERFAEDL
jgi:hypothetical protein